jgi:small basic protein (TIGR04137 family)
MSIHKSLKLGSGLARRRSVLTRAERVAKMTAENKLDDDASVFGLPKLRVVVRVIKKKKKKGPEEGEEGAEGVEGAEGTAAPAEGEKKG